LHALCFSADGRTLASASFDLNRTPAGRWGRIRLWETASGREVASFLGDPGWIGGAKLAYSRDGRVLATTASGGLASLWEIASGRERLRIGPGQRGGGPIAFSPDGRLLAIACWDQTVRIIQLATGREIHAFKGHTDQISALVFSPDGKTLVSGSQDTTALVWDMSVVQAKDRVEEVKLTDAEARALWEKLGADPASAWPALVSLSAAPRQAIPLLRESLRPERQDEDRRIAQLIRNLDAEEFAVRENASKELGEMGKVCVPALRQALAQPPSAEVRHRAEAILNHLKEHAGSPARLRQLRAVEVLERIGSAEAKRILRGLAGGAAAQLTREAERALQRLTP
jgi:hypothetical protein